MSRIEEKLKTLNIQLGEARPPVGNYIGCKVAGNLLYASGRVSDLKGKVGKDISEANAKKAAHDTVLLILAIIKSDIKDLDLLKGVVKVQGFINCTDDFLELPKVLDGASDLLVSLFGEDGKHARTATGVAQLPFGTTIQLDIIFEPNY
jgi:enamine deaminase RidA (YjgF/YER057c/UK114 family)